MARALAAARTGFRRLFSISAFTPPPPANVPPPADPSPNLFVSGLSKRTTSEGLREAFSKFGSLVHARVVTDRVSGYSKGFGFVRYATVEEASEGIKGMDGKFLDGWVIFAEYAKPRPPPPQIQSPQFSQNAAGSAPPPNYTSQTSQSWSSYGSPQASEPLQSYSNYTPQESQPPSNYWHQSPPASQTPSSNSSVPPPNYSETSPPPSSFASSVQATNYSQAPESQQGYGWASQSWNPPPASQPPNYAPPSYPPQASHPTYSSTHQTPQPANGSAGNYEAHTENQTSEPSYNFDSERAARYY